MKKGGGKGKGSIVKCGETPCGGVGDRGWGACENLMELSMCDGPIETHEYIWCIFDQCLIGFCHITAEIPSFCIELIK